MKFLELKNIIQTNELLKRYTELFKGSKIEFEVYSCKKTREERRNKTIDDPLGFFINALEMAFEDESFKTLILEDFHKTKPSKLFNDIAYILVINNKSTKETVEYVTYIKLLLKQTIGIYNADIYKITNLRQIYEDVYLMYNKKMKRILIIKMNCK
ncbi:hypothetical protein EHP00_1017 [Ecytonucleospora hepatopenaei]|uniref:Uncharacterized protein n=1 Tax=Ecytonucleospora hepatopenaei TaxID=646526 RepID=A0A1W0E515_9MICR|nr:hypothetical protein EHP00_1017 [Ecytonucleospora hepatopenaei]